jgi:catechol 2,3-dioxygenase-like lactoylglutathione lyase family enzyme
MIIGAHAIIYSKNPDSDRAFLRDVLGLSGVDVGGGWLIFGLPPAELAVHPSEKNDIHEVYLMCDNMEDFLAEMKSRGVDCAPAQNPGWGLLTKVSLPGGGTLGVYQPRHARPKPMSTGRRSSVRRPVGRAPKKPVRRPSVKTGRKRARS